MKCLSLCILIMIERDLVRHSFLNIFLFCHTVIVFLSKWSIGPRKRLLIQQKVNLLCRGKLIFNMSPVKYVSFDVWIQTIINIKGCSFAIASTDIYCDQWQNDNLPWYSEQLQVPWILLIIHSSKFFLQNFYSCSRTR